MSQGSAYWAGALSINLRHREDRASCPFYCQVIGAAAMATMLSPPKPSRPGISAHLRFANMVPAGTDMLTNPGGRPTRGQACRPSNSCQDNFRGLECVVSSGRQNMLYAALQ
ncbi:unnamed protein product [Prunus armeniaca]|uniref:Uncharacterized protein n=1 Tax=Prunus armeniaca TaxID=36596 RepID=A0A6J5VEC2_PRUAR|nr:unnamed protein product [Prunus armeniaca]